MMKMKATFLRPGFMAIMVILLILAPFNSIAQDTLARTENFVTWSGKEDNNNKFLLSLDQVPYFLERAFLFDLMFSDGNIVVMQTQITASEMEVKASCDLQPDMVIRILEKYRMEAMKRYSELSDPEKEELIKKYAKYR